jgi:hypothetical protein
METPKQFFFVFSSGEYSDYRIGSLYVCDHEVTEAEWDEHYRAYRDESNLRSRTFNRLSYQDPSRTALYQEWDKWTRENNPEVSFIKRHGMREIEYLEFQRD